MKKRPLMRRKRIMAPKECSFCTEKKEPTFMDVEPLRKFLTERQKIIGRTRNGLCTKHQRRLTLSVKHARHLALLPFVGHH